MPHKLLVVEDEPRLRIDLVDFLALRGYDAEGAGSLAEARERIAVRPPQAIILDIRLPDGNGFDFATELRRAGDIGIVMLTALAESEDRIRGYGSGADIYLAKQSSLREIEAAVASLLNRIAPIRTWQLDRKDWTLLSPTGTAIRLTATELAFLVELCAARGEPASRDALAAAMARPRANWDHRHLDAVVNRLRRKIKDATAEEAPIRMIYGRGYAFIAPISQS